MEAWASRVLHIFPIYPNHWNTLKCTNDLDRTSQENENGFSLLLYACPCNCRWTGSSIKLMLDLKSIHSLFIHLFKVLLLIWIFYYSSDSDYKQTISLPLNTAVHFSIWITLFMITEQYIIVTFPLKAKHCCTYQCSIVYASVLASITICIHFRSVVTNPDCNTFDLYPSLTL